MVHPSGRDPIEWCGAPFNKSEIRVDPALHSLKNLKNYAPEEHLRHEASLQREHFSLRCLMKTPVIVLCSGNSNGGLFIKKKQINMNTLNNNAAITLSVSRRRVKLRSR